MSAIRKKNSESPIAVSYKIMYNEQTMGVQNNNHDPEFLKEKLKQRPLNRRKLLRRMLITVLMAVLFGLVASVTILLLEPIISERLYPENEEQELIFFPEDIIEDEILPEDMIADEREMHEIQLAQEAENNPPSDIIDYDLVRRIASDLIDQKEFGIDELYSMFNARNEIAKEARKSLVTVTGLTSDVNWINNIFERRVETAGIIVLDTETELMILAKLALIRNADTIMLTFANGRQYPAEIKQYDKVTGFAVLSVSHTQLSAGTLNAIKVIDLGSSLSLNMTGMPVIAIGRIAVDADSTQYGFITSSSYSIRKVDATYKLMTTDIYGSTNASGVLINWDGEVVGIIDNDYNTSDARNIVSAVGISELKKLIEAMIKDEEKPYIGIIGIDVTSEAHEAGVPRGAYITEIVIDSPAMDAGLQMADIIIKVEDTEISSFYSFVSTIFRYKPDQNIKMTALRQGSAGYYEIEVEVLAGHSQ